MFAFGECTDWIKSRAAGTSSPSSDSAYSESTVKYRIQVWRYFVNKLY